MPAAAGTEPEQHRAPTARPVLRARCKRLHPNGWIFGRERAAHAAEGHVNGTKADFPVGVAPCPRCRPPRLLGRFVV